MASATTAGLSQSAAILIGMFISCVLYGIFFVLFGGILYVFLYKRTTAPNPILLIASILIFAFSTANLVLGCWRAYNGFIVSTINPDVYLLQASWSYTLEAAILIAESIVADFIMIYRCYAVWNYSRRIIAFNVLLWLGCIAIGVVYTIVGTGTQTASAWIVGTQNWAIIYTSLTFAQNVICTTLTAYRLWSVDRAAAPYREQSLTPIVWIIVESGAVYSATLLVFLVLESLGVFTITSLFVEILEPLIGITFSLIIVRVKLGLTKDTQITPIARSSRTRPTESGSVRPMPITIKVHRDIEVDGDATPDDDGRAFSRQETDDTYSLKPSGRQNDLEL